MRHTGLVVIFFQSTARAQDSGQHDQRLALRGVADAN
jgi:hypothetical protein